MSAKYDVVVVGAGVAGLYASLHLASLGWRVALVESKQRDRIGDRVCGDAIGVHHFTELGLQVPDSLVDHRYRGVRIFSPTGKHSIVVPGEGVSVNRQKFGQWLLKQALDKGVELFDRHVVVDITLKEDALKSVKARSISGSSAELEASAFIDASGYKPAIRSKLPVEWPISERPYVTDYNIAYREIIELEQSLNIADANYADIYIDTEIAPGGYWWLFSKSSNGLVVNVGLGVVMNGSYNPQHMFVKYLKPEFRGKPLHAGGGVVPTRRPLPTLVWKNVCTVGDAAYTVNPVHGGGIGSSMLSSHVVSKYLTEALEAGKVSEELMWRANVDYMFSYGAKQAALDVLRMFMQKLSNSDYEWIIENRVVDGSLVYDIGTKGDLADKIVHSVLILVKLIGKPSLLNRLRSVKNYMDRARELYSALYPKHPSDFNSWLIRANKLIEEYVDSIGYTRGSKVKW
ncbi:MAG: geranylgeranyl reductase family protein [Desulfurococcaceae archaeon]